MAKRLKKEFPRLPILLLLDGMFAEGPVFQCCKDNHWEFFINLKDDDLPSVNQEFRNLQSLNPANTRIIRNDGVIQRFTWINEISYRDSQKREFSLNVLECREKEVKVTPTDGEIPEKRHDGAFFEGETTFRWIISFEISFDNAKTLGKTARCRWKIENQGFNTQKNLGFELEHPYSEDQVGMKVYYYLLQIAHIWVQLCERGSLLGIAVPEGFGALKNVAFRLLEEWRIFSLFQSAWEELRTTRIQIRLDTS